MNTSNSNTNYHMDKSIVLFFIITILLTTTIFAYKYVNYTPCEVVDFKVNARNLRVGEIIRFKDDTKGAIQREWDFGDGSEIEKGIVPYHTYDKPGKYVVRLVVNGRCENTQEIAIAEKVFIIDSTRIAKFNMPDHIEVGKTLKIIDSTLGATTWEWRFGETANVNSTEKNPEYVFQTSGLKTVSLVVNGDPRYGTSKKINVLPKINAITAPPTGRRPPTRPPTRPPINVLPIAPTTDPIGVEPATDPVPEIVKAPFINEKDFKSKIMEVSQEKANTNDFSNYLCDNLGLSILVNKKRTSFSDFCDKIKGKKIRVDELELYRDENNCIKNIKVKYKRTSMF